MITKKPGIKDCVRINSEIDIPDFLKSVVILKENMIILDCLEGEEKVPLGSVIAYEKLENGKMNVWNKANWKETTTEINGVFYELPKPNKAIPVTESLPKSIVNSLGDRFSVLQDGTYQIDAGWGLVTCAPDDGYLVIYGTKEDGSLDANFLTKGTPSFKQYFVLNDNNQIVQSLEEYDANLETTKNKKI